MVAIDADGGEIADPAQLRHARRRCMPRAARSTGSPASSGAIETTRCVACGSSRGELGATARCRRRRSGSMPASRKRVELLRRARRAGDRDRAVRPRRGEGLAGIAGAEDEDASMSCGSLSIVASAPAAAHSSRTVGVGFAVMAARRAPRIRCASSSRDSAQTAAPRTSGEASPSSVAAARRPAPRRRNCRRRSARCARSGRGRCA